MFEDGEFNGEVNLFEDGEFNGEVNMVGDSDVFSPTIVLVKSTVDFGEVTVFKLASISSNSLGGVKRFVDDAVGGTRDGMLRGGGL